MLNSQFCDTQHLQRFLSWPHQKAYQNISITHPFKTKCPHHQCCTQYLCPQENHQKTIFKKRSHNNAVAVKTGGGKNVTSNTQKNKRNMLIVGLVISIEYKNTAHDTLWLGLLLNSWKLNSTVLATRKHMQNLSKRNGPAEIEVTMTLFCHPFEYSQNNCYRPIHPERRFSKKSIFSDLTYIMVDGSKKKKTKLILKCPEGYMWIKILKKRKSGWGVVSFARCVNFMVM